MRERIIQKLITIAKSLNNIKSVQRNLPSEDELSSIPFSDMPVVCIAGQLPVPEYQARNAQNLRASVEINFNYYLIQNETPDETISVLWDDLWAKLLTANATWGHERIEIIQSNLFYFDPYIVLNFKMRCTGIIELISE